MAYRALILFALILLPRYVLAESIPAAQLYVTPQATCTDLSSAGHAQCKQAATDGGYMDGWYWGALRGDGRYQCEFRISASSTFYPPDYMQPFPSTSGCGVGCPSGQNWTLSGASCVRPDCPSGSVRQSDGTCSNPCAALSGQPVSSGYYDMGADPKKMQSVGCASAAGGGGCLAVFSGTYPVKTSIVLGQVHYYAQGGYNYYDPAIHGSNPDTSCDPADPADKPAPSSVAAIPADQCAANQGYAAMNGKTVCIDNATGQPTPATASQAAQSSSSTTSTTDGNGVTTTTTTTTTTTGDTITKTTVIQPNGDTSTTETGPQEDKPVYGQDAGAPAIGTLSHNFVITPDANPFGAGGCPAPIPVLGNQLSFQTACDAFGTIRPLVIALGWLIAGFIFVGGLRNG